MIVVDSSALFAILFKEEEKSNFVEKLLYSEDNYISAGTYVESHIVAITSKKNVSINELKELIKTFNIKIYEVNEEIADLAIEAFAKYGKGLHKAGLNFGDCFSYATAKYLNAELLYKGLDFDKADLNFPLA